MLLNCHSFYSLCYGTLSPEELIDGALANGYDHIVVSDINNTSAVIDSLRLGKEKGIQISVGIDFRNSIDQLYIGIASTNDGYKALNDFLSQHLHSGLEFPILAPKLKNTIFIYPLTQYHGEKLNPNEYIGIRSQELSSLPFFKYKIPIEKCVPLHTVSFKDKRGFNTHRLLRAIDKNTLLSRLDPKDQASLDDMMMSRENLENLYKEHPILIENARKILDNSQVEFEMGSLKSKNKKYFSTNAQEDILLLRKLCMDGIPYRYTNQSSEIVDRIEKELKIIEQMSFAAYFLINWDLVNYAQQKNYFYVGRGSGANSIVAYLLRITDVDPIELDLYFERFINPYRNNPPDFDIDFSWTDREDITRYIFEKYGAEHTALLGTYTTFQKDSMIRELGKVFGLPSFEIDRLQQLKSEQTLDTMSQLVLKYTQLIAGMPSHLSIHSSGIIISELPIHTYTGTFLPPKGYPTTQFSMIEAEDIGLAKFDILSQRGLGKIKDAVELIRENQGIDIDIHEIQKFKEDIKVKRLLSEGKCIGCFYIESPAMRMLLTKLKADDYLRLVAASSIIRPGVSKSGMMNEYILRYRDEKRRQAAQKAIPDLYEILKETYGVMVYQEDVIKVAHYFAGLSLAEADYLRRGMSWKFKKRNEFNRVKENFYKNCIEKGYLQKPIDDIWNQIESFANYAFSKAHSASYAVESFQALYLKAYYPLEYMVATLNNGGGFYRPEFYVHEARMCGAEILVPDINQSDIVTRIVGKKVYLGFQMIQEITLDTIEKTIHERNKNGEYSNLSDFIQRTSVSLDQIILLIRVGAFGNSSMNKKELLWQAHLQVNPKKKPISKDLFEVKRKEYQLPKLEHSWLDDAFDEMELLGFPICSPFKLLKGELPSKLVSKDLRKLIGKNVGIVGYYCTTKRTMTSKGEKMYFGTFIDQNGEWLDTVHFPPSARKYPLRGSGLYLIEGQVIEEFEFIYIDVKRLQKLPSMNRDDAL